MDVSNMYYMAHVYLMEGLVRGVVTCKAIIIKFIQVR